MISPADLHGYQARASGKRIPAGKQTKKGEPISAPEEQLAWQLTGAGITYQRDYAFIQAGMDLQTFLLNGSLSRGRRRWRIRQTCPIHWL